MPATAASLRCTVPGMATDAERRAAPPVLGHMNCSTPQTCCFGTGPTAQFIGTAPYLS